MIAHLQTLKWAIGIAIVLAALVGFPYYYKQNQLNKARLNEVVDYALIARDSAIVYKNKYNQAVTQVEASRLDKETIGKLRGDLEEITSRFDGINKKLNNVEQLSKATINAVAEFKGELADTVIVKDSIDRPAYKFEVGDQYFHVEGLAIPSLKQVTIKPTFAAEIYAATYWKRKHKFLGIRFGKKEYRSEITSDNPYLTIPKYKVVTKKD